jgi:hypothetical protein
MARATSPVGLARVLCISDQPIPPLAKNVGMKTYIVTDYLIGSTEEAAKADGYGKLSSLRDWCRLRLK